MQRFTVALLCNTDKPTLDINALARKFAAVVMGAPYVDAAAVDISIEALQEFSGRYFQASQGPHGQQVELSLCNQQLCIAGTLPLRCIGGGAFVAQNGTSNYWSQQSIASSVRHQQRYRCCYQ